MINTDDIVKGDGAMVLAVFPEGGEDSGKSKLIGFYKTGDEGFTVIFEVKVSFFPVMTVGDYASLVLRLFGQAVWNFRFSPSGG